MVPDTTAGKIPLTVRFTGTTIVSVELDGRVIPQEEYSMYREQIYGPVMKQRQLEENIRNISKEIDEIKQKLFYNESDTAFVYELDSVQKIRIKLLADDISVYREEAGTFLNDALRYGNITDLQSAIDLAREKIMEESVLEPDTAKQTGDMIRLMNPALREKMLDQLDSLNMILEEWKMKNKDLVLEDENRLQDELMRLEEDLQDQQEKLSRLQRMFVSEYLPVPATAEKKNSGKKNGKKKRRRKRR